MPRCLHLLTGSHRQLQRLRLGPLGVSFRPSRGFHATPIDRIRLLHRTAGRLRLTKDLARDVPPYAVLSHIWGPDPDEISFQDVTEGTGRDKAGYSKIEFCEEQAERDGLQYFWVDTCCIDKSNHAELSEAINSMYRWYRDSQRCYVYLADVPNKDKGDSEAWDEMFRVSRWHTRGWTLQELVAPSSVEFFTGDGQRVGDKRSFKQQLHEITGIPLAVFEGTPIYDFEIEERFRWAARRQTTRPEDQAYCLLGIFDVFMPMIYGEGRGNALRRLRQEIDLARRQRKDAREPVILVPYSENKAFVGRSLILSRLRDMQVISMSQSRMALFGLGGIGKTQIALAHTFWLRKHHSDVSVFWLHAGSADRLRQAYAAIAQKCQVPGCDDPKADLMLLVKMWLAQEQNGRWLMVVDNADDMDLISAAGLADYLPDCAHGSILVTTRNKKVASRLCPGGTILAVEHMEDHEAEQLLRRTLGAGNWGLDELQALSAKLDHLPLALVQATSFIQENSMSVGQYLGLLEDSDQNLVDLLSEDFEALGRDSATPRAVTGAWILSFEQIRKNNGRASELLSFMSLFDRQGIPLEFVSWYCDQQDNYSTLQFQKDLGILKAFSFITTAEDSSLNMHRLVQLVTRKWLASQHNPTRFYDQAILAVASLFPAGQYENWGACERYLPHLVVLDHDFTESNDIAGAAATILQNVAIYLVLRGRQYQAENIQARVVGLHIEIHGREHLATWASMTDLALIHRHQGRRDAAVKALGEVTEMLRQRFGVEDARTLHSMRLLAATYPRERLGDAESLLLEVLTITTRLHGEEHIDTLAVMKDLAWAYVEQGRWHDAHELLGRLLESCRKQWGADDPRTVHCLAFLATSFARQERWTEAEQLHTKVMELYAKQLGHDHPTTVYHMGELAKIYVSQRRLNEALTLQQDVVDKHKRRFGERHPATLSSLALLAHIWGHQSPEQVHAAALLAWDVLEGYAALYGDEHPDTLTSMHAAACMLAGTGAAVAMEEAEALGTRALDGREKLLGERHPDTLQSMYGVAQIYHALGRLDEALALRNRYLALAKAGVDVGNMDYVLAALELVDWETQVILKELSSLGVTANGSAT